MANDMVISQPPEWSHLVSDSPQWTWREGKLWHVQAKEKSREKTKSNKFKSFIVRNIYGTHNSSVAVRNAIKKLISTLRDEEWGLNFGSGETKIHGKFLNLDIYDCTGIDIIATGTKLPFKNDCLGVALTQEVLEHVADPFAVIQEIWHVLKPDGLFYCQVPFQIGYHPGPEDYWRFTEGALKFLFENDRWTIEDLGISVGHGSGFYRIFVEFLAVSFSCLHNSLYMPAKGIAAVILVPLKLFDLLTPLSKNCARIPGGFYCVARKKS